jgi:hypothetical protein
MMFAGTPGPVKARPIRGDDPSCEVQQNNREGPLHHGISIVEQSLELRHRPAGFPKNALQSRQLDNTTGVIRHGYSVSFATNEDAMGAALPIQCITGL